MESWQEVRCCASGCPSVSWSSCSSCWEGSISVSVHSELRPAVLSTLHVLLYQFGSDTNDVLALPVLDHVQGLEGADDVLMSDAGQVAAGQKRGCGVR